MSSKCLVVIEVSQKQRYIFSSNRLRENIGASIVVAKMTKEIPIMALQDYVKRGNDEFGTISFYDINNEGYFDDNVFCYDGGGKSIYQFLNREDAKQFIQVTSRYIIKNYFGIELFYALQEYDTSNEMEAVDKLYEKLEEKKQTRRQSFRLYGIGLNEKCPSTSLPINILNREDRIPKRLINAAEADIKRIQDDIKVNSPNLDTYGKDGFNLQVYTKLAEVNGQDDFFQKYLPEQYRERYRFPHDMDDLGGTKNEKNLIAIITIDGNGMGERIKGLKDALENKKQKASYIRVLKENSDYITEVYESAIRQVTKILCENWTKLKEILSLREDRNGTRYLPIRPLIAAGDDICLLTDARIALSVTTELLKAINEKSKRAAITEKIIKNSKIDNGFNFMELIPEGGLFASAGFVICKQKYPFCRAYEIAEGLCSNAKKRLSKEKNLKEKGASMLDFHIAMGELEDSITKEREKRKLDDNIDTKKPFVVEPDEKGLVFDYDNFKKAITMLEKFNDNETESDVKKADFKSGTEKGVGKSKLKEFAYYIRQGNEMAKSFVNQTSKMSETVNFKGLESLNGDYSIFLDAIEMLDFHIDIKKWRRDNSNGDV